MRNRSKRLIVSSILVIVVILVSAYTVLAGSDFYESSYNYDYFNCRSKCYTEYAQSKITSQSSSLLYAKVTVKYKENGSIYYSSGDNLYISTCEIKLYRQHSGITTLSAKHWYKIGGTQVYYTSTTA